MSRNGLIGITDCYSTGDPASSFFAFERDPFEVDTLVAIEVVADEVNLNSGVLSTDSSGTVLTLNGVAVSGGATGPTGPQGPAGDTGPTGATGPAGALPADASFNSVALNTLTEAVAAGGVDISANVTITNDNSLTATTVVVQDIAKTGPDSRISIDPGISDDVITTSQFLLPTNIGPGGTVSFVLNNSTDQPCNWFSGIFAVSATLTVGGPTIPFNQAMFSYSPNNVVNIFQQFQIGLTLAVGSDAFGNPVLTWTNTSGGAYTTPLNVRVLKVC